MNIIEAIKSGKRFKRKGHALWSDGPKYSVMVTMDWSDIVADDWEVEEKMIEITHSQFFEAIDRAEKKFDGHLGMKWLLAQELGL
jgi:hypothetical protein